MKGKESEGWIVTDKNYGKDDTIVDKNGRKRSTDVESEHQTSPNLKAKYYCHHGFWMQKVRGIVELF
jgi:hypothetical protein